MNTGICVIIVFLWLKEITLFFCRRIATWVVSLEVEIVILPSFQILVRTLLSCNTNACARACPLDHYTPPPTLSRSMCKASQPHTLPHAEEVVSRPCPATRLFLSKQVSRNYNSEYGQKTCTHHKVKWNEGVSNWYLCIETNKNYVNILLTPHAKVYVWKSSSC